MGGGWMGGWRGVAGGWANSGYKALFSACLQVLPSNREETDRGKSWRAHLPLSSSFFLFLLLALVSSKTPTQACTHTNKDTQSLSVCTCFSPIDTVTAKALSLISSQDGCCPPVTKEDEERRARRGRMRELRRNRQRGKKMQCKTHTHIHQGCCHSICCSVPHFAI